MFRILSIILVSVFFLSGCLSDLEMSNPPPSFDDQMASLEYSAGRVPDDQMPPLYQDEGPYRKYTNEGSSGQSYVAAPAPRPAQRAPSAASSEVAEVPFDQTRRTGSAASGAQS